MVLHAALPHAVAAGEKRLEMVSRVYRGDGAHWLTEIPSYRQVRSADVYRGIDLLWTSSGGEVEYQFLVGARADASGIAWRIEGARGIHVDDSGDLMVEAGANALRCRRPFAFQDIHGRRGAVDVRYEVDGETVKLRLGEYNHSLPLIIDPVISYSALIGGSGYDAGYAVALDAAGNVFLTGTTASNDFPGASYGRENQDVFVTKLSPKGALLWSTILASNGNDVGSAIAVDSGGNVYVAGTVGGTGFPTTTGAFKTVTNGVPDAFVAKLNTTGQLVYCTLLGGAGADSATGIRVDASGNAYVVGSTTSTNFPVTTGAPQTAFRGGYDGFVTKLNATGSALIYSTLVGGTGQDLLQSIALNASGIACVAGSTASTDLATVNPLQASMNGSMSVMVGCLNAGGTAWNFLTYLGGSGTDQALGIALDTTGNLYLTGSTSSVDFPTTVGVFQTVQQGGYDAFVTKINAAGQAVIYSTYLGGAANETGNAIAVDRYGRAIVAGFTGSFNFPTQNAVQNANKGAFDAFVSGVSAAGDSLFFSTYLGGSGDDRGFGLALSNTSFHSLWTTGYSGSVDFPMTAAGVPAPFNAFATQISFPQQIGTYRPSTWTLDANGNGTLDAGDFNFTYGQSASTPIWGDWNGDGETKIGCYYQGFWYLDMNGDGIWDAGDMLIQWGNSTGVPVTGDWNGDGRTKIGFFDHGTWYLDVNGNGILDAGDRIFMWGSATSIPVIGDWNGDGRSKAGVVQAGVWYLDVMDTGFWATGDVVFAWGSSTMTPIVGDWSGDGRTKAGSFDPATGNWYLDVTGDGTWEAGDLAFGWGNSTATPVIGDWNGDGRAKAGVFMPGGWYLDTNGDGIWDAGDQHLTFGLPTDTPVVGRWR